MDDQDRIEQALRDAFAVQPDPDARERARIRVLAAATPSVPRRAGLRRRRGLVMPLAAMFLAVSATGAAAVPVSAHALPGDPLYGVRMATEKIRISLARDPADEAAVRLSIAHARTIDLDRAIGKGREHAIAEIARRFFEQVGAADALADETDGVTSAKIDALVAAQRARLAAIADRIEGRIGDRSRATTVLRDIRRHDDEEAPRGRGKPQGPPSERPGRGNDDGDGSPGRSSDRGNSEGKRRNGGVEDADGRGNSNPKGAGRGKGNG